MLIVALFIGTAVLGGTAFGALMAAFADRDVRKGLSAPPEPAQRVRMEAWARHTGWRCGAGDDLAVAETAGQILDLVGGSAREGLVGLAVTSADGRLIAFETRRDDRALVFAASRRAGAHSWLRIDVDRHGARTAEGPGLREGVTADLLDGLDAPACVRALAGWIVVGTAGALEPVLLERVLDRLGEVVRVLGDAPGGARL